VRARLVTILIVLAAWPLFPAEKPQTWIRLRSPNFIVFTNDNEKQVHRVAYQFEMVQAVFQEYFGTKSSTKNDALLIIVAKDENTLKALLPEYWANKGSAHPVGFYLGGQAQDYIALRLDPKLNQLGSEPYETVYHEYIHYLTRRMISHSPLWMVEGLAKFYGNTRIDGKHVYVGAPSDLDLRILRQNQLLPLSTLFDINASSPYYHEENRASIFYAESWALTHYLVARDWREKTHRVNDFIALLDQNVAQVEAARRTIGDPNALGTALSQYIHQPTLNAALLEEPAIDESDFKTQTISEAESLAVRADFMAHDQHYAEAREMLQESLKLDPKLAAADEGMGFVCLQEGKTEEAGKWASKALALNSQSYLANYYYALSLIKGKLDDDTAAKAESSLRAALKINPDFAPAYNALAGVLALAWRYSKPDEAYLLALHAVQLEPGNVFYRIQSVHVLERLGRAEDAVQVANLALSMAKTPQEQEEASKALSSAQQFLASQKRAANFVSPSNPTDFFYKEALAAANDGDYTTAMDELKHVLELNPSYPSVWNEIGRIYLRQDEPDSAAASFRKEVETNASSPFAYNDLGLALQRQEKWDEAIQYFQKQLQITPDDRNAHQNLGYLFEKRKDYARAIPELQKAVSLSPRNAALLVPLANAYCKSAQEQKCMSALNEAVNIADTPLNWNNIAWYMAIWEFKLDEALKYAQRAVASIATSLSVVSIDHVTSRDLQHVSALANYWDTLGWVYFQRGDLSEAERYLLSAWQLRHDGLVGSHLGQVYEKLGRKDEAVRLYSLSLETANPESGTRDRLIALAGKDATSTEKIARYSDELTKMSIVQVTHTPAISATADFYIELAPAKGPNVGFICGTPTLKSATGQLAGVSYPVSFPDSQPLMLILRGELVCTAEDKLCNLKLLSPSVASRESAEAQRALEIVGDTMGVDFSSYAQTLFGTVSSSWNKVIPDKARPPEMKNGKVSILFAIQPEGKLDHLDISRSSGDFELDRAAYDAILNSLPFAPLPLGFTGPSLSFRFNFNYNPGLDACGIPETDLAH